MFRVWAGKAGFAGAVTVTTAGAPKVAKRRNTGESPWEAATDGATNQNKVSTCARPAAAPANTNSHRLKILRPILRM